MNLTKFATVTCAICVILVMAGPAQARVQPADYRAMVIALSQQETANTGLASGLGACLATTFAKKPEQSHCFDAAQRKWTDALQVTTVMLRDVVQDGPSARCTSDLHAFVAETTRSIDGMKAYGTAARAGRLTSKNLPGYDRVRAAILSKMPARLTRDCAP